MLPVAPVNAALLMHLPLDNNLNDSTGNGHNGSMPGGNENPAYTAAVFNQGLNFDGNNDFITVPSFDPGSTFSASLWVNHDNIGALNTFIEHANNGNNRNDFYIGYDNSNNSLTVELEDNNSTEGGACGDPKFCTGIVLQDSRWYHLVVTVTPTTLKVYVDTVLAYDVTHSTTINFGNGSWMLGGDTDNNPVTQASTDYLDGRIDDVRIYNHELTQTEISTLYGLVANWNLDDCNIAAAGDIKDSSGNNLHATPFNGATTATGRICTALSLDGTDDYAEVTDNNALDLSTSLTVMAWIRPDTLPGGGLMTILSKDENYEFHLTPSGNINWWWNNSSGGTRQFNSTVAVPINTWTHVAIVYEAGSQRIVINGVERGTTSYNETLITNADPLQIGADQLYAGRYFDGLIDEIKIYNRALSTEEINGYYTSPNPLNRTCPVCTGGGSCETFRDEFSTTSYSRQDGTANWATNWIETGDNNNASNGDIEIDTGELQLEGDGSGPSIEREADLSSYTTATLTFDYRTSGGWEPSDDLEIYISNNGGGSWTLLDIFSDDQAVSSYTRDISTSISSNTRIRFVEAANNGSELFHIDNVQIEACSGPPSTTQNIILSTTGNETLGGLSFSDGSLAEYVASTDTATLYFNENLFSGNADIDAVHVLANGIIILSTDNNETLGGLSFGPDDLVAYDPSTNTATLYFDGGALFSNTNEDIDAVYIRDNGNIILSTTGDATLGGISFADGDLIEYIPSSNTASLFFDESNFSGGADIDGVHILSNGNILLSTENTESLPGLANFENGSIVEYNVSTNTASTFFDEDRFSGGADVNALTLTPVATPFHHLEFIHDQDAVTCNAEAITIKACANADCSTLVTTDVTASLLPTGWVGGDSLNFTGSTSYSLKHTVAETVTLDTSSISPTPTNANECKDSGGASISCDMVFNSSGFIFNNETDASTIIPTQLSGKSSDTGYNAKTLSLQAVRASDSDPAQCVAAFQNQTLNIDFSAECKNPTSCVAGQLFNLTSGAITGNLTATTNDDGVAGSSSYDTRSIAFDANGKTNIVFTYPEAGMIELHVRHNMLLADGTTPSGNYMTGSSSFIVRPLGFSIDFSGQRAADYIDNGLLDDSTTTNLSYAADASGSVFVKAGDNFVATLTAVQWQAADDSDNDGVPDTGANLTNNLTTQNFGNESTAIIPADINTSHTVTLVPNTGTLTNSSNSVSFANGIGTKTFAWSEVGILNITTTLSNYLTTGGNIIGTTQNVGRFIPDHFDTTIIHGCSGGSIFTYSGQPFSVSAYAKNTSGSTTQNYENTFAYTTTLSDAGINPIVNFTNNTISAASFANGIGTRADVAYTFPAKETIPAIITLRANDADTGSATGIVEGTTEIRSGRTRLENAYGSELMDMAVPARVEFYNSNGFEINTDDTCSTISVILTDIGTDPVQVGTGLTGETCIWDDDAESGTANCTNAAILPGPVSLQFEEPPVAGSFNLFLLAPGANNTGDIGISLTSPTWLQFDWDGDGNHDNEPSSTASFGLYRGDDRIIYQREVF